MSRRQAQDFAQDAGTQNRSLHGLVRRMAIRLTRTVLWQLTGYRNSEVGTETADAEPYTGIGFYARPKAGDNAEAVIVQVGDSRHVVLVACRNEDARRAVVNALNGGSGLAEDETVVYSRAAMVHIKNDGTVEIKAPLGVVQPTIKGTSYRSAEDTMLTLLQSLCTALATSCPPLGSPAQQAATAAAATAAATGITTFQGGSAGYLSTVAKVQ